MFDIGAVIDLRTYKMFILTGVAILLALAGCSDQKLRTGSILIDSAPPGATVTVDGESLGSTPLELQGLSLGTWKGTLERPGYVPEPFEITVQPGEELLGSYPLTPYLSVMIQDAGKLDRPEAPVEWFVMSAAMKAAEWVGMGPYPELPIEAYWTNATLASNSGRLMAHYYISTTANPIANDFSELPPDDRVMGTLSLWITPKEFWEVRYIEGDLALVRLMYRGETPLDFVVVKGSTSGTWKLLRLLDDETIFKTATVRDIQTGNSVFQNMLKMYDEE